MSSDIGSYSCDEEDTHNQQRTTETYYSEKVSSQSTYIQDCFGRDESANMFENIDSLDTSDMLEKLSGRSKVETGSQVARSIISSLFKNIDCDKDSLTRLPEIDEDFGEEEVEMISGDLKLDRVERLRSSSPSSSVLDPVFQSPKTVARISSWINDLQSDISFDTLDKSIKTDIHHSSASVKSRNTKSSVSSRKSDKFVDDDIYSDEEDDQPSGYTSIMEVSSLEAPQTPRIGLETSRTSTRPWGSNHRRNWSMSPGCHFLQQEDKEVPRNRYMKIVETTSERLRREEDGTRTLDRVHTLEKSEKSLDDPSLLPSLGLVSVLGLLLLLLLLPLLPDQYDLLNHVKNITSPPGGRIFGNLVEEQI